SNSGGRPAPARREADLLRALPTLGRRDPGDHAEAMRLLRRSLVTGRSFEVRARAVLALGELGDPAGVPDLAAVREKSDDPVLRFLAARELGTLGESRSPGGAAALEALRVGLQDQDPRVRETAAHGLGARRDQASEALLIAAAKDEPWPFARRAQIEALSRTCGPPARELLMRAMERDVDEVRRAALVGVVRCKDARAATTLLSTLKARRASATLRELAGALLGELGDRAVADALADALAALVNEAEADLAIEGVVVAALRSLGALGGPAAAGAAARLATDVRHPYRALAVDVLGDICDPGAGARALAAVRAGTDAALATAAQTSERRCHARPAP
ncbi:MAG: HEAT repeat domain-containing protein, partial [Haliangium ochraceum]